MDGVSLFWPSISLLFLIKCSLSVVYLWKRGCVFELFVISSSLSLISLVFSQQFFQSSPCLCSMSEPPRRADALCQSDRLQRFSSGPASSPSNKNIALVFGFRVNMVYLWQLPLCSLAAFVFFLSFFLLLMSLSCLMVNRWNTLPHRRLPSPGLLGENNTRAVQIPERLYPNTHTHNHNTPGSFTETSISFV